MKKERRDEVDRERRGEEVSEWTNLQNKGLISVDRRTNTWPALKVMCKGGWVG